jgi:hypothetical protein
MELLAEAENIIARAGLKASSRQLLLLAQDVSKTRSDLSTLLPVSAPHGSGEQATARRSMDPMKIALRVLTAHANGAQAEATDLSALERMYGKKPDAAGWDEFACDSIQSVLRDRASARQTFVLGVGVR